MHRVTLLFCAALANAATACGTNTKTSNRPLFPDGYVVIQATVFNGLTGESIADPNVRVQVGHHVLPSEKTNGIYIIYGIPASTPVFVLADAPGFSSFIARVDINGVGSVANGDYFYRFYNILMYPTGTVPGDLLISVYDADGAAIDGAVVVATLASANALVPAESPLVSGVGILPSSVVTTTAGSGKATLGGTQLIMGARYSIDVFGALDTDGVFLVPSENNDIIVGESIPEIVVFLDRPVQSPVALAANSEATGTYSDLVVTFPYAITVCTEAVDHTWRNTTSFHPNVVDDGDGVTAAPAATDPVAVSPGEGDTTLTLGYVTNVANNSNAAFDAGDSLWIRFEGVRLKPKGASDASCTDLDSVSVRAGATTVNTEIHVNQP